MIHISVAELGLTCMLAALVLFIPLFIKRGQAQMKKIKDLEDKINKKR